MSYTREIAEEVILDYNQYHENLERKIYIEDKQFLDHKFPQKVVENDEKKEKLEKLIDKLNKLLS